jgi:hypothetical protein
VAEGEVWVPHVARGRFVVEIELYDDQDQAARLDSERPKDAEGRDQVFVVT